MCSYSKLLPLRSIEFLSGEIVLDIVQPVVTLATADSEQGRASTLFVFFLPAKG